MFVTSSPIVDKKATMFVTSSQSVDENIFAARIPEPVKSEPVKLPEVEAKDQLSTFVNVKNDCYQVRPSSSIPNFINSGSEFDASSSQRSSRIFKRQNHTIKDHYQNPDALSILKTKMYSVDDPR
jgi:hypothetical protein